MWYNQIHFTIFHFLLFFGLSNVTKKRKNRKKSSRTVKLLKIPNNLIINSKFFLFIDRKYRTPTFSTKEIKNSFEILCFRGKRGKKRKERKARCSPLKLILHPFLTSLIAPRERIQEAPHSRRRSSSPFVPEHRSDRTGDSSRGNVPLFIILSQIRSRTH